MKADRSISANFMLFTWKWHLFMLSAAYITNVSKNKQCGLNQTAPDLGLHLSASTLIEKVGLPAFKTF